MNTNEKIKAKALLGDQKHTLKGVLLNPTRTELIITIAKLLEVAYSQDKGLTTKIVRAKGAFKLTVDQNSNARLTGKLGAFSFSGSDTLDKIGANIKFVNVSFSNGGSGNIKYTAMIDIKSAKIAITGNFNIEKLLTSCSGLLCKAARALKGRQHAYDMELQRITGH